MIPPDLVNWKLLHYNFICMCFTKGQHKRMYATRAYSKHELYLVPHAIWKLGLHVR